LSPSNRSVSALSIGGQPLWSFNAPYGTNGVAYRNDVTYITTSDNYLHAVNQDGEELWKVYTKSRSVGPSFGKGGRLYLPTRDGVFAISESGDIEWEFELFFGQVSPISIDALGNLYFQQENTLISLSAEGAVRWMSTLPINSSPTAPVISANGRVYVGTSSGVYAYTMYIHAYLQQVTCIGIIPAVILIPADQK